MTHLYHIVALNRGTRTQFRTLATSPQEARVKAEAQGFVVESITFIS